MSEVDHDIRQMLRERADDVRPSSTLPGSTLRRSRRRRATVSMVSFSLVLLLVGGTVVGVAALRRQNVRPLPDVTKPVLRETIKLPGHPIDIVAGLGAVWAQTENGTVRIDPDSGRVVTTIGYSVKGLRYFPYPRTLAIGDGYIWLAGSRSRPADSPIVLRQGSGSQSAEAGPSIVATAGGAAHQRQATVQFSMQASPVGSPSPQLLPPPNSRESWSVLRIDPRTNRMDVLASVRGWHPNELAAADGFVWVAGGSGSGGAAYKIDAKTGRLLSSWRTVGRVVSIRAGAGSVWIGSQWEGGGEVERLEVRTNRPRLFWSLGFGTLRNVTLGEEGIWAGVIDLNGRSTVVRADPVTDRILGGHALPVPLRYVLAAGGAVWTTSAESEGSIYWFDPVTGHEGHISGLKSPGRLAVGYGQLWLTGIGDTDTLTIFTLTR